MCHISIFNSDWHMDVMLMYCHFYCSLGRVVLGGALHCQVEHHVQLKKSTFYIKHHQNESKIYQILHNVYKIV